MSSSGDTDVLVEVPPDFFLVSSSSDSEASSDHPRRSYGSAKAGVISELVGHIQFLESRISAIETKDNSLDATILNNSLGLHMQGSTSIRQRQTLPRTRHCISQSHSLQTTPVKPSHSLSVPSTPSGYSLVNHTNGQQIDMRLGACLSGKQDTNTNNNNSVQIKHDLMSEPFVKLSASHDMGLPHVTVAATSARDPLPNHCKNSSTSFVTQSNECFHLQPTTSNVLSARRNYLHPKVVRQLDMTEVDELLQEMEVTELELSRRINQANHYQQAQNYQKKEDEDSLQKSSKKLEFHPETSKQESVEFLPIQSHKKMDTFPDISLPYTDSFPIDDASKMISEFKAWEQSVRQDGSNNFGFIEPQTKNLHNASGRSNASNVKAKGLNTEHYTSSVEDISTLSTPNVRIPTVQAYPNNVINATQAVTYNPVQSGKHMEQNFSLNSEACTEAQIKSSKQTVTDSEQIPFAKCKDHAFTNAVFHPRVSQKILSLSDFWDNSSNKSQEELLRIRLEEERFRREHCEHLIQELQKRLLEQQEKVAVALRVDSNKNDLISQLHTAWTKIKDRLHALETEDQKLQSELKNVTEKHQAEVADYQAQVKRYEGELSKALDLAAGYKEKSDETIQEKVELLKSHADELERCKYLAQEAENRYEQLKGEYNKLLEKNQQTEEKLKNLQQELSKERLRGGEVRNEMNVIHKALDTCEAELTILRQEKENLQLKLKEEVNRNAILEQKNVSFIASLNDAKKAEKLAKDETKSIAEQKEKIRAELQEVYQKQVDEVVKVKWQEFQTQLDAAESEFLEELKTRQQVIAECAARKIKDVMDKHRLEINLLEEKHKEEKRLGELQLAQAIQKSAILETQLHSQRANKSQLAEQLHSVMQKQWQQALQIISGGSMENPTPLQRIHAEKFFESKGPKKSESLPNCYSKMTQEPTKLPRQLTDAKSLYTLLQREDHNETRSTMTPIEDTPVTSKKESKADLRKYIRMIAEMQQPTEDFTRVRETVPSPPLVCREVPRKHYTKQEFSIMSEDSVTWQPVPETTSKESIDFAPTVQKTTPKNDQHRSKPPWK